MRGVDWPGAVHVARNDLRLMFRDRGTVFWSFVGPFLFVLFFGFLFRDNGAADKTIVHIENQDTSAALAHAMSVLLKDEDLVVKDAVGNPDSIAGFVLIIPAGSADTLAAGKMPHLVLKTSETDPTPREQTLRAVLIRSLMASFLGLTPADVRGDLDEAAIRQRVKFEPTVRLETKTLPHAGPTLGFQHTIPAYLVMFLLMTLMTSSAEILIAERRAGQLQRAQVSSLGSREILFGKFLSRFSFAWLQIIVMIGMGLAVFGVKMGAHPEALFAALVAFALCATGLGLLFATLFSHSDKAGGVGSLLVMAMAALGGCWWPLEIVPAWMRKIAFFLPTGWGYDALNRVMALNATLPQIATHLAVLLGIAAITLPLSIRRLAQRT